MFKRLISRLDIKSKNLVKGVNMEGLRKIGSPNHFANLYYKDGIDEIHYQDFVASLYNRNSLANIIEENVKNIFVIVCVGGGIRKIQDMDQILRLGADKVSINTAAVNNKELIEIASKKFGSSTISVSIDTIKNKNNYKVVIESGKQLTEIDLFKWLEETQKLGVGEIVLNSIEFEGLQKGYDIELYKNAKRYCSVPLVAHGGAGKKEDLLKLFVETDVDGASIASLLHYSYIQAENNDKDFTDHFNKKKNLRFSAIKITELKKYLKREGVNVRV